MGYQPLEQLLPQANYSVYKLVCMAAKRAKELADGSPHLIEISSCAKTATIALEEIRAGKVVMKDVAEQFDPGQKKKSPKSDTKEKSEQEEAVVQEQGV